MSFFRRPRLTNYGAAGLIPLVTTLLLAALMLLPIGTGLSNVAMPHLVLICVFYWSCTRPLLMPYGAAAFVGFMLDLWLDVPLGLNMLILVLCRFFVLNQIKYFKGRSRLVYWGVFSLMAMALFLIMWVITSAARGEFSPVKPVAIQLGLTVFGYALLGLILGRLRRSLLK